MKRGWSSTLVAPYGTFFGHGGHDIKSEYAREMFDSTFMRPRHGWLVVDGYPVLSKVNKLGESRPGSQFDYFFFEVVSKGDF